MSTLALYCRLSSEDGNDGESFSIANQRDLLRCYVGQHPELSKWDVLEFQDDGYSGISFDRPGLQEMLKLAGGMVKCIVVKDFSRFGRNLVEVGNYLDQIFPFLGVRFISINENFDSDRNKGQTIGLDVSLQAMVYEMYSRDISAKIQCVQQAKMRKGEYICAIAPYGFSRSQTEKNKLVPDPETAPVVKRIFQMAAEGMRLVDIAKQLNGDGILSPLMYRKANGTYNMRGWTTKAEECFWSAANVKRILKDERFTGTLVSRKRTITDVRKTTSYTLPKEQWIVAENAHEAVISKELFDYVQSLFKSNPQSKRHAAKLPFAGLIRCAVCGRSLLFNRHSHPYYTCPTHRTAPDISCKTIRLADEDLRQCVLRSLQIQTQLFLEHEKSNRTTSNPAHSVGYRLEQLQLQIDRLKASNVMLFEDFATGKLSKDSFVVKKRGLAEQLTELDAQRLLMLERLAREKQESEEQQKRNIDLGRYTCVNVLTREMLLELVKVIRVSPDNTVEIVWNFKDSIQG